ncbi:MAG: protein kinase [Fuerstiella sp.]
MDSPAYANTQQSNPIYVAPTLAMLIDCFPMVEMIEVLGHGGMGAVYKVRQKRLDRLAALKIVRPDVANDPAFTARFDREARTLARLNHPNIVGVYDFGDVPAPTVSGGSSQSLYYFLMEYVDGINLRQLIEARQVSPDQALSIVSQVCDALQYAHDNGVVHRDIKPENILLDDAGRVKIADFGLAKLGAEVDDIQLTGTNQVLGTVRYMAPEQMQGSGSVDHRADIYSLGVVLYEMLTGETPIGVFAPPSKRVPIDVRLDEVVMKSLASDPNQRYQTISEVNLCVQRLVDGQLDSAAADPSEVKYRGASTIFEDGVAAVADKFRGFWGRSPAPAPEAKPPKAAAGYGFAELGQGLNAIGRELGGFADAFTPEEDLGRTDVLIPKDSCQGHHFPDCCVVCGQVTKRRQTQEFSVGMPAAAPFIVVFMILFFPIGILIAILTTKKKRLSLPVCMRHRHHWLSMVLFASIGWVLIPAGVFAGLFAGDFITGDGENVPILLSCIFAGIIAYVGPLIYLGLTRVKADEITADGIRVRNVSPPFAATFQHSGVV